MPSIQMITVLMFGMVLRNIGEVISAKDEWLTISSELSGKTVEQYAQEITEFWTNERLNRAIPKPLIDIDVLPNKQKNSKTTTNPDKDMQPILVQGTLPSGITSKRAGYPNTVGKVFFVDGGYLHSCSASVVTANNKDMIVTAGHCVYSTTTNASVTNFIFIPQYDNNTRPYGTWTARAMRTFSNWAYQSDFNYDVAIVLLYTLNGQHIQDVVGSQAIGFNYGHSGTIHSFGYPSNFLNGQMMTYCTGAKYFPNLNGYTVDAMPCTMNQGCSGGPWLETFSFPSLSGIQTSVNSFTFNSTPGVMYGPYFGSSVLSMYNYLKDDTGTTSTTSTTKAPSKANSCRCSIILLLPLALFQQYLLNSFVVYLQ